MTPVRFEQADWYDAPRYYDMIFDVDTDQEARFLEEVAERWAPKAKRSLLEPACGSGRLLVAMAKRGWTVSGFDANMHMLDFARKRCHAARVPVRLKQGRLESFRYANTFSLAHCLVSTFKYVQTEGGAVSHLKGVAQSLGKGGVYVLGFHLSEYDNPHRVRERWVVHRRGTQVVCNIQQWPPDRVQRREKVRSRLIVRQNAVTRRFETTWSFRSYSVGQVRRLLKAVPALEHVATYNFDYQVDRPMHLDGARLDIVLVLRKR